MIRMSGMSCRAMQRNRKSEYSSTNHGRVPRDRGLHLKRRAQRRKRASMRAPQRNASTRGSTVVAPKDRRDSASPPIGRQSTLSLGMTWRHSKRASYGPLPEDARTTRPSTCAPHLRKSHGRTRRPGPDDGHKTAAR
eukprot:scaffold214723_cov35-Tisochrysis_lutea.AAC.1